MPRIEILLPEGPDTGEGNPTIDVCRNCRPAFIEDETLTSQTLHLLLLSKREFQDGCRVGSRDVEHPSYEGDRVRCEVCGALLLKWDNHGDSKDIWPPT